MHFAIKLSLLLVLITQILFSNYLHATIHDFHNMYIYIITYWIWLHHGLQSNKIERDFYKAISIIIHFIPISTIMATL